MTPEEIAKHCDAILRDLKFIQQHADLMYELLESPEAKKKGMWHGHEISKGSSMIQYSLHKLKKEL